MSLNAIDTAREIYTIGANSRESEIFRTLHSLSTNPNRAEVPQYSLFEKYFNDGNYADTLVTKAFNEVPPFDPSYITIKQRTLIVRRTLQYMVMYMAPLTEMYTAINDCGKIFSLFIPFFCDANMFVCPFRIRQRYS